MASSFSSLRDLLKDPSSPKPKTIDGFLPPFSSSSSSSKTDEVLSDSESLDEEQNDDVYSVEGNVSDTCASLSDDDVGEADGKGGVAIGRKSIALTAKGTLPPPPITCLKKIKEGKPCVYACFDENVGRCTIEAVTIPNGDLLCANRGSGSLKLYFNDRPESKEKPKEVKKEDGNNGEVKVIGGDEVDEGKMP